MDDDRFDAVLRAMASQKTRREALRILVQGTAGILAAGCSSLPHGSRGTSAGPTATSATLSGNTIACQPTNTVRTPCGSLGDYVSQCGVICPDGQPLKGKGGCTDPKA